MEYLDGITIVTFNEKFPNDSVCVDFLQEIGLLPKKEAFENTPCPTPNCKRVLTCTDCKPQDGYKIKWRIRCTGRKNRVNRRIVRSGCGKTWNPIKNSWFERSHLSFRDILLITYGFVCKLPLTFMKFHFCIGDSSLIEWCSLCRKVCKDIMEKRKIGGPGLQVELSRTFVYIRKYQERIHKYKMWCLGGICRESNTMFVIPIRTGNREAIHTLIRQFVEPLSFIYTDSWSAYTGIEMNYDPITSLGCGMAAHFIINSSHKFEKTVIVTHPITNEEVSVICNTTKIERQWIQLKRSIKSCSFLATDKRNHAELYIAEFIYRRECLKHLRGHCDEMLKQFLSDIKTIYPALDLRSIYLSSNPTNNHIEIEESDIIYIVHAD